MDLITLLNILLIVFIFYLLINNKYKKQINSGVKKLFNFDINNYLNLQEDMTNNNNAILREPEMPLLSRPKPEVDDESEKRNKNQMGDVVQKSNLNTIEDFSINDLLSYNVNPLEASDRYTNDYVSANFKSNVLDIRKYFKINADKPTVHRDLDLEYSDNYINDCFDKRNSNNHVWKYKDSPVMNGGNFFDNVYANNPMNEYYASIDQQDNLLSYDGAKNKYTDDIRSGMGIPSRMWWENN